MRSLRLPLLSALVLLAAWLPGTAQTSGNRPVIDKIDPPNWWTELPAPMLVVHGDHLQDARLSVQGDGVQLTRTQNSANGHWAILWLETSHANAQTLHIHAENPDGSAQAEFQLAQRTTTHNTPPGFSAADVLYLLMPDRFAQGDAAHTATPAQREAPRGWHGGDLKGVEQHIDYLKQLGVTTVWMTPVVSNAAMTESYHGYAATDLYAIDSHYGTVQDYRHLAEALHAQGMKLVIDIVPNHIGVKHPWVLDPPAPEWLHGSLAAHRPVQYDFYQLVNPHASTAAWKNITDGWFTDAMPDLNQENPLVSRYLIENTIWWVETAHVDGIRLDTMPYVGRTFWQQYHSALHNLYPHLTTVGEIFHRDPEVVSFFAGGVAHDSIDTGLDTPFDFPIYYTLRDVLAHGRPMTELAEVLRKDALYPHPERLTTFVGNHDTTRFLTEAGGSVARLKLAMGVETVLRGMPMVYSGDEIAMAGGEDPDNRRDFPGGFPGDAHNAFTAAGRTAEQQEVFVWTAALLHLRATHHVLQTGLEENLFADENRIALVRAQDREGCSRHLGEERILAVVSKSETGSTLDLPLNETALTGCTTLQPLFPTDAEAATIQAGVAHLHTAPLSLTLYKVE